MTETTPKITMQLTASAAYQTHNLVLISIAAIIDHISDNSKYMTR